MMFPRWRLTSNVRLTGLVGGGWVLADLRDLSCHELADPAGELLQAGTPPAEAGDAEVEFLKYCFDAGWLESAG